MRYDGWGNLTPSGYFKFDLGESAFSDYSGFHRHAQAFGGACGESASPRTAAIKLIQYCRPFARAIVATDIFPTTQVVSDAFRRLPSLSACVSLSVNRFVV